MTHLLAWGLPQGSEWIIIGLIGLLIFGKRLPEVGRSIGQMIVNFKKGMRDAQDEISNAGELPDKKADQQALPQGNYKFDPMTGRPLESNQPASGEQKSMKFDPYTGEPLKS